MITFSLTCHDDCLIDLLQERRLAAIEHMTQMEEEMKEAQEQIRLRKEEQDRAVIGSKRWGMKESRVYTYRQNG